ncbi:hypothetical protein RJ640_019553 [Escallonia rubra]|uniref:Integrase catalytic domain-containing protein n=1 Tax=Escallonia rubra TaxID=112253 RepID=A0AA88UD94_9ASTE|nr:hypothetical protein RJ640_019553 [Escallonia rubra]
MSEEGKEKIGKFNGMNFQWWKMQFEDYLCQKDLYLPLVGKKPEEMNANEWAILERKVLATVRLSLTPQVAFNISKDKIVAAMMQALKKLCEKPSVSNKIFLMKRLFNMRMSENSSVVDHLNDFNALVESEIENKIKCLQSDNGGEYRDEVFQEYRSNNIIMLIRTVKRTPQENGLAERMDKAIMERARSLASTLNGGIPEEDGQILLTGHQHNPEGSLRARLVA